MSRGPSTSYGTWPDVTRFDDLTVEQTVVEAFGSDGPYEGLDIGLIATEYRDAINAALPDGVVVAGNEFYGPYDRSGLPVDFNLEWAVASVELWPIIMRHVDELPETE